MKLESYRLIEKVGTFTLPEGAVLVASPDWARRRYGSCGGLTVAMVESRNEGVIDILKSDGSKLGVLEPAGAVFYAVCS